MAKEGSLVWARNAFRRDQLWPGVVLPEGSVPAFIQRLQTPGRVCICFYGPSIAQSRVRDYFWLPVEDLVAWAEYSITEQPEVNETYADHAEALKAAHEEALSVDAGYLDPIQGMLPKVDPSAPSCACCGKTLKPKEAAEAKEQQDRCNDCQQLFIDGQHCAVCRRVWFDYESHALATCKRCGARVHAACDARADKSVKATTLERASAVKQEHQDEPMDIDQQQQLVAADTALQRQQQQATAPYNCPSCCQKEADESRMDLLHLHAVVLADIKPNKPRPAAEIFAAEVARKHLASGGQMDLQLLQGLISKAWVEEEDKGKYEQQAQKEQQAYWAAVPQYDALFRQYVNLAASLRREVDLSLALEPQRVLGSGSVVLARGTTATYNTTAAGTTGHLLPAGGSSSRGQQQAQLMSATRSSAAAAAAVAPTPLPTAPATASSAGPGGRGGRPPHVSVLGSGAVIKAEDGSDVPQQIPIICNTTKGTFLLAEMRVICSCPSCTVQPLDKRTFSPTQFEQHAGAGSAKKWKSSLRIEPGGVNECPHGANPMAFGKWMDIKGIEAKGSKVSAAHATPSAADVAPPLLDGPAASVKRDRTEPQHRNFSHLPGSATSTEVLAASGERGSSPASSSKGPADGAAAAGAAAAITSSAEQKPASTGVPKNRRADSWAPWEDVNLGQYKPIQVKFAGDRCCVCDSDVDFDIDRLVSCDGCGITVHQSCYGIPEIPEEDDMWLCRSCELKEPGAPEPQCCLCPMTGGGLKPTTLPGLWAHAACMQWIPEVSCVEPLRMEPIDRIQHIQKERWELLCCICRQRMGAKIQCNDCYQAYHPLCARRMGLHMEMLEPAVPDGPLQLLTFCPRHCKPRPEKSGITLLSPEDAFRMGRPRKRLNNAAGGSSSTAADHPSSSTAADAINNGLWNAQPFKCNKPPATIPSAPGGCARATAFAAKQISHGTGTGRTSIAGFWIPSADAAAVASEDGGPDSSSNMGGAGGLQGSITSGADAAAATAAGKSGRKRRRWGKGSSAKVHNSRTTMRPKVTKLSASNEPPPEVELLPLPEGVSDRVSVVCNGRSAMFILRPQRVLVGDQEMTASRFEAMCGKGDAKKWKSSLWAADADGQPEVSMGDWLSARGLDKAALAKLISNWTAHELRQTWEQQQAAAGGDEQPPEGADADADGDGDGEPSAKADSSVGEGAADGATTEDGEEVSESHADQEQDGDDDDDGRGVVNNTAAAPATGYEGGCVPTPAAGGHADQVQPDTGAQGLEQQLSSDAQHHPIAADADEPAAKRQKLPEAMFVPAANGLSTSTPAPDATCLQQQQEEVVECDVDSPVLLDQQVLPEPPKPQQLQQLQDNSVTEAAIASGIVAVAATATVTDGGGIVEVVHEGHEGQQQAAAASAAALRRQKGLVLLLKMHYKQLPDTFKVHPSSLPQEALTTVGKQQEQRQQGSDQWVDAVLMDNAATSVATPAGDGSSCGGVEQVSATSNPWLVVGRCCRMYWPDDDAWYEADVTSYDSSTGKHKLWYHIDEVEEEIDMVAEEKEGRVQWLPLVDKLKWPDPPEKQQQDQQPAGAGMLEGMMEGFTGATGLMHWQQTALAGAWSQHDQQLHSMMQLAGVTDMQQQQQLLPASQQQHAVHPVTLASFEHDADQQAEQSTIQQRAQLPVGFPRITAMSRIPNSSSNVNLLTLAANGANLQQQMQRISQQQQQQYQQYNSAQPGPGEAPAGSAAVGWRVAVFVPQAGAFYYGQVTEYTPDTEIHTIEYDDGLRENVQLQQARVDWVTAGGHDVSHAGKQAHQAYMQQRLVAATAEYHQQKRLQQQQVGAAEDRQQQVVAALQLQLQQTLAEIQQLGLQPGMPAPDHLQQRTQQLVLLLQHHQQQQQVVTTQQQYAVVNTVGPAAAVTDGVAPTAAATGSGPKPGPKPGAPSQVDIICGTNTAIFDCVRMAVLMPTGGYISPTEFERVSGKGSSKKWKCTIRVRKANGLPGITMGDWLIQMGYDQPKQPAAGGEGSGRVRTSLNDIRRQYASRKVAAPAAVKRSSSSGGASEGVKTSAAAGQSVVTTRGVALHRDGCMCVICKQARRKAAQEAGIAPNPEDAYVPRQPGEGKIGVSSRSAGYHGKPSPGPRGSSFVAKDGLLAPAEDLAEQRRKKLKLPTVLVGKRAYVRAVPQLVRGAAVHQLWQIPESRSYTADEWEALHAPSGSKSAGVAAADTAAAADVGPAAHGSRAGTPSLSGSRAATPPFPAGAGDLYADAANSTVEAAAAALQPTAQQQDGQPMPQQQKQVEKPEKKASRTQTFREKLRVCQALENKRITFGKSGIHGWGIFARADIPQDTMVTEFRGQLVRCILADVREHAYRKEHRDCYMFHATDETVIDNTKGGNYARFTNHCCHPCLYAKPLELGGELHLCFFARTDIKMGQELTFDYRFKEEEGDDKILCQCGAPNCKGTLN